MIYGGDNYEIEKQTTNLFFSFIFAAGYLTINEEYKNGSSDFVKLANHEVRSELGKKLSSTV